MACQFLACRRRWCPVQWRGQPREEHTVGEWGVGIGIPKRGLSCLNTEMPSGRSSGEAETEHDGDTKQ